MAAETTRPRVNPASYNPNTAYRAGGFGSSPIPGTSNYIPQARPKATPPSAAPAASASPSTSPRLVRDKEGKLATITPNSRGGYTVRDADGDVRTVTPRAAGGYTIREKGGATRVVSKLPSGYSAFDP